MFEEVLRLGTQEKSIPLATMQGTDIPNDQPCAYDPADVARNIQDLRGLMGLWSERCPARSHYNCAGLAWAARRTCIRDSATYRLILEEDGYRKISEDEAQLGDVALYVMRASDQINHVATVCEVRQGIGALRHRALFVLSKMSDWGPEVIHHWADLPQVPIPWNIEFWTDRP